MDGRTAVICKSEVLHLRLTEHEAYLLLVVGGKVADPSTLRVAISHYVL